MVDIGHDTEERRRNAVALLDADLRGLLKLSVAKVRKHEQDEHSRGRRGVACASSVWTCSAWTRPEMWWRWLHSWMLGNLRVQGSPSGTRRKQRQELQACQALNKVEIQELFVRFQKVHGIKLEDRNTPAASTLEQIFDQVEQGEFKNMSLVQFLSREDAEADVLGATVEKGTGALKIKKGYMESARSPGRLRNSESECLRIRSCSLS